MKFPLTLVFITCVTVPLTIRFGKVVTVGPTIEEVPVNITTPVPETVLPLFVQLLSIVIFPIYN